MVSNMLLETRGDYEFSNRLNANLRDIAKELKRANDNKETGVGECVWILAGTGRDGDWEPEVYAAESLAKKAFSDYVAQYRNDGIELDVDDGNMMANYDSQGDYGSFLVTKHKVRR